MERNHCYCVNQNSKPSYKWWPKTDSLCSLSKIDENVEYKQILNFVHIYHKLPEYQSGFSQIHGTATALLRESDDMITTYGNSKAPSLLEFSKTFVALNHSPLSLVLILNRVSTWDGASKRYLMLRNLQILKNVQLGVSQKSILGPCLFKIQSICPKRFKTATLRWQDSNLLQFLTGACLFPQLQLT